MAYTACKSTSIEGNSLLLGQRFQHKTNSVGLLERFAVCYLRIVCKQSLRNESKRQVKFSVMVQNELGFLTKLSKVGDEIFFPNLTRVL